MRCPLYNDPREPWDVEDDVPAFYRNGHATAPDVIEVDEPCEEPAFAFGFQIPSAHGTIANPSRQARALLHRRNR